VDRDRTAGEKLQGELRTAGAKRHFITAELSLAENCKKVIEDTIRIAGRLDALVNNAGVNDRVGLEHGSPEQYVASLQRNLLHYYNMAHYALPWLIKS